MVAILCALDRQRVTDNFAETLLEDARDPVALQLVFEIGFFRRDIRGQAAFLPSVVKGIFVRGQDVLRIRADDLRNELNTLFESKNISLRKDATSIPANFLRVTVKVN